MNDEIMTLKDVAEYLKLAGKTAYRLAVGGKLPDIEKWIEQNKRRKTL